MTQHSLVFVAHVNPCLGTDADDVLGELTEATDKEWMVAYNAPGAGSFRINVHSEQAAWCAQGNYVRVYRDTVGGQLLGGFFIETGSEMLVTDDEEAGQVRTLAGRGSLAILERAILYNRSYLDNGGDLGALPQDDPDGMWHWTDRPPGAILVRQLEEAQARGDPDPVANSAIPPVSWDFTRHEDSDGASWSTSAGDLFKLPVGMDMLTMLAVLQDISLVVSMDGDFNLRAWDTDQGESTDILFAEGTNLRPTVDRELKARTSISHALVQGDLASGKHTYRKVDDGDAGVTVEAVVGRVEGFVPYQYTPSSTKLDSAGKTAIRRAYRKLEGVDTLPVLETDDEMALVHYFPGDLVAFSTIAGGTAPDKRIAAIRFFDRDNDEYDVDVQFEGGPAITGTSPGLNNRCNCPCDLGSDITGTSPVAYLGEMYVGGASAGNVVSGGTDELVAFVDQSDSVRMPYVPGTAYAVVGGVIYFDTGGGGSDPTTGYITITGATGTASVIARVACTPDIPGEG